ncbi:MAG: hypothetical protein M3Z96_09120 [Pseudomonadota bacterium]|nr:hypothetical protein [Pseudomonadota bacterium]
MRPLTIFLSRLLGLFALLLSLAMVLHRQSFVETAATLIHDRPLLLVLGMITLIAGLAMVLAHNIWSDGTLPVVVTLIGWITLIRSLILLLLPPQAVVSLFVMFHFEELFYLYAAITFVLGLYLTFMGFRRSRG